MFSRRLLTKTKMNLRYFYSKTITDHYYSPKNLGSLDRSNKSVGTGVVGGPSCGEVRKFQVEVDDGKQVDREFKTYGCGSAIASSSYGSEYIKGKDLDEAYNFTNRDIAKHLNLPPVKLHCSMLMEDAIKAAIDNYNGKQ